VDFDGVGLEIPVVSLVRISSERDGSNALHEYKKGAGNTADPSLAYPAKMPR
jgi:hypothetical protein